MRLEVKPCRPSKAGKNSLQVFCPADRRHLRGCIADQALVNELLRRLGDISSPKKGYGDDDPNGSDQLGPDNV